MESKKELAVARKIKDSESRANALRELASHFQGELKNRLLVEAVAAARKIKDLGSRIWALKVLALHFRDKQKTQILEEVIGITRKIKDKDARARALSEELKELAPYFRGKQKTQMLEEAVGVTRTIKDEDARARALFQVLLKLASEFDGVQREELLQESHTVTRKIKALDTRVRLLSKLALYFDGQDRKKILEEALATTRRIKSNASRSWALQALAPQFDGKRRKQILREAFSTACEIRDLAYRARVLKDLLLQFDNIHIRREFKKALSATRQVWGRGKRSRTTGVRKNSALSAAHRKPKKQIKEKIYFTSYHPIDGRVEYWHNLLVYAHISSILAKVRKDVKRFDDQIKLHKETRSKSTTPVARGTELAIVPFCEGVTFNPERVSFKWMEDFHRADFRFKADKSLSDDAAKGNIDIYVGPLIIGTLKFAMLFNEKATHPVLEHEESAKMYGKDDVFISYSRKDTDVARTFKTVLEGIGLDVFLDVDDIRSGQLWEDELKRRIERAKIFQIFWSANYSQSENCKQEWEYALKQNKDEGFIRPVFWEKPLTPKPPEELNKFNFKYVEVKISKSE